MAAKTVIIIGGPTASGKTAAAIHIARHFQTEIVSADSRQCFRELNIGVARPTAAELAAVPHHFVASHSIHDKVTAATFEAYALDKMAQLLEQHDVVVMAGGTGLYIKAFCEGLDVIPEVPEAIQTAVRENYAVQGLAWLQEEVARLDPAFYATGEIHNPHRLMRALAVLKATGQSILAFRKGVQAERPFRIIKLAMELPRPELHQRINQRVDNMLQLGLEAEVRGLLPFQQCNALQTVGYRELFAFYNGMGTLQQAVEAIKTNTRQYAKRQITWFRKDAAFAWFAPQDTASMLTHIEGAM